MKLGRYSLIRRIGAGGMAEVWKARFHGPDGFAKTVAIKKILPHLVLEGSFVEMFVAEAKLIAKLTHPNIVQLVDFARIEDPEDNNRPDYFIAMEYVAGQHLGTILRKAAEKGIKIPAEVGIYITEEVAKALGYAHAEGAVLGNPRAVVHQDISPSNILVSYSGAVKVADFGIANVVRALIPQQEGRVTGKVGYMSPEQARAQKLDARSDIFSLGIVLCELMTGRRLFSGKTAPEILQKIVKFEFPEAVLSDNGVPYEVREVLRRALMVDRVDRYQQASEMEAELSAILDRGSHIQARNLLAQMIQNLFTDEYENEVAEEMGDDEIEEDATTTRQMTNPHMERELPPDPVSELNVPMAARTESFSGGGVTTGSASAEQVVESESTGTVRGTDTTKIIDRSMIRQEDDPPTLEPGGQPSINVREDDPTILGPRPDLSSDAEIGPIGGPDESPSRSSRATPSSRSSSVRPVQPPRPAPSVDPPTAPVQAVTDVPPRGSVVDYPDRKASGSSPLKWALIAFIVMVGLAAALLIVAGLMKPDDIAQVTPTPTATVASTPLETVTVNEVTLPPMTPTPEETPEPTEEISSTPRRTPVQRTPRPTPRRTPVQRTPTPRPTPRPTTAVKRYGYLTVNARPWAETWIGGKRISREALNRRKLPAGTHTVEFVNPVKDFRVRKTIRIYPGRETSVFVDVPANRVVVQNQ